MEEFGEGPQRSLKTSSRGCVYTVCESGECNLCALPIQQAVQKSETSLLEIKSYNG